MPQTRLYMCELAEKLKKKNGDTKCKALLWDEIITLGWYLNNFNCATPSSEYYKGIFFNVDS